MAVCWHSSGPVTGGLRVVEPREIAISLVNDARLSPLGDMWDKQGQGTTRLV